MKTIEHKSSSRGYMDHGWLKTNHSFSFANYYNPEKMRFGVLRVLNDDYLAGGKGFGFHPHDNMEIITIMLEGELRHQDSMGNSEVLRENEVQVMSAGSGIQHSEFNNLPDKELNLLQIWIYPEKKDIKPTYSQTIFLSDDRIDKWQRIVSPIGNDGLTINQQTYISRSELSEGSELSYDFHSSENGAYVFVISGNIRIGDSILNTRDSLGVWDTNNLEIKAESNSDILLIEVPMGE
jgi:redox-sensitive bicupin YhaK (pirin superfamily)